jgi:hypothetical protein
MKILVLFLTMFVLTTSAFASGKLQVQPNYFVDSKQVKPMIGLSVYEKASFFKGAYNGWYGYGDQAFVDRSNVQWYSIRNAIDFYTPSKLVISPGVQSILVDGESRWQNRIFVRASYDLW